MSAITEWAPPCTPSWSCTCFLDGLPHEHPDGPSSPPCDVGERPVARPARPKPDTERARRYRLPIIGPPPLPEPGHDLLTALESHRPDSDDAHGWGERLRSCEALQRMLAALTCESIIGLQTALAAQDEAMDVPALMRDADAVSGEVSLLVQCSTQSAERRVDAARALVSRLPDTWTALRQARTSWGAALTLIELTEGLDRQTCALIESGLWPAQHDHTPAQIRRRTRALIVRHAPDLFEQRSEQAALRRTIRRLRDPAGGSTLIEVELPALPAEALWQDLTLLAGPDRDRLPGDTRDLDTRRIDALCRAVGDAAARHVEQPAVSGSAWEQRCRVVVTVGLDTLLGHIDEPSTIDGLGAVTAGQARALALAALAAGAPLDRIVTDPVSGIAVAATPIRGPAPRPATKRSSDPHRYHPGDPLTRLLRARDSTCSNPTCQTEATDCDADHTRPHHHGGPTDSANMSLRCRGHHRAKQHPAVTVRRMTAVFGDAAIPVETWASRTGHIWATRPPDLRE